jgi:hypothetical protein
MTVGMFRRVGIDAFSQHNCRHCFICPNCDFNMIEMIFMIKKNHMNQNNHFKITVQIFFIVLGDTFSPLQLPSLRGTKQSPIHQIYRLYRRLRVKARNDDVQRIPILNSQFSNSFVVWATASYLPMTGGLIRESLVCREKTGGLHVNNPQ